MTDDHANLKTKDSSTAPSSDHSVCSIADSLVPPVKFRALRMPDRDLATLPNKKLKSFYERQNRLIDRYEQVDRVVEALQETEPCTRYGTTGSSRDIENQWDDSSSAHTPLLPTATPDASPAWLIRLAINTSFVINIGLFLVKMALALFSGSMAILATAFESFLDILSNAIIFCTSVFIRKKDYYAYPVGKSRIEPLGIIVFSVVITTSFGQVLLTSIKQLTSREGADRQIHLDGLGLGILIGNIGIKAALWFWCSRVKGSSSVQVLAQDHRNDVLFNSASAIFPIVAVWAYSPWVDPAGAIVLSLYIIYEWSTLLLGNVRRLAGQVADTDDLKQFTYMAYRFSNKILAVDTVRAYYIGDRLLVEIDIILPPHIELHEAHDIGEALQNALERMENVERAFVHLDYNSSHQVEHMRVVNDIGFGRD